MQKVLCASMAALAAMLAPAFATDLSVAPIYNSPPPPQPETWSGPYTAFTGSGVWSSSKTPDSTTGIAGSSGFNLGTSSVGVSSGLNIQNGKWVLGYESDTIVTRKSSEIAPTVAWGGEVKERWLSTYRGRVGVAQDNWLFYATAGGALANIQQNIVSPMGGPSSDARWYWGWAAGAGVEWKVSADWSAKMEYLYLGLQDKSYLNPAPSQFTDQRVRPDDHSVRVGVNYKLPWNILDSFFASKPR